MVTKRRWTIKQGARRRYYRGGVQKLSRARAWSYDISRWTGTKREALALAAALRRDNKYWDARVVREPKRWPRR